MALQVIRVVIIKDNLDINDISDTPDKLRSDMFRLETSRDILINKIIAVYLENIYVNPDKLRCGNI